MTIPAMIPETEHRTQAWLTVSLLWGVGCLNYLDRMMLMTMRSSLIETIPMNDVQFGLLTTLFLWIYAMFSPVAGYLADRLNRSLVIIASFITWSAVTWMTAYATTYEQLLATRALMGISEACYIPAALALISDYHRTTTRSIANGIHMTGIMAGGALGGLGGWIAEMLEWQYAFKLFGIIGIVMAFVLILFLRDRPGTKTGSPLAGTPSVQSVRLRGAVKSLFGDRQFPLVICYWSLMAICTWAVVGWMPTYLKEQFSLSQTKAGFFATGYFQVSALLGVLIGGAWADRWSKKHERGPIFVVMIGVCIAASGIFVTSATSILPAAIAGLACFGLAKAFADANMMPILTLISDRRYRATGYGILNFCACVIGGLGNLLGGVLRDANINVTRVFQIGAACFIISFIILFFIRPAPKPSS